MNKIELKKSELIDELIENKKRFLLVSNTGTLLDLFKSHEAMLTQGNKDLESSVLEAIGSDTGGSDLDLKGVQFKIFNLARMDNLALARQIFERMLDEKRWVACSKKECRDACPICINVDLIHKNKERVLYRIFLAYRRMYEYGVRLTLRQLTEHLAYILTSGLEGSDIRIMQEKAHRPLTIEFLFFNRFFGDDGGEADMAAIRMKAVKAVLEQGFGDRPSPLWEHRLWLKTYGQTFPFDVPGCEKVFEILRDQGAEPMAGPMSRYHRTVPGNRFGECYTFSTISKIRIKPISDSFSIRLPSSTGWTGNHPKVGCNQGKLQGSAKKYTMSSKNILPVSGYRKVLPKAETGVCILP